MQPLHMMHSLADTVNKVAVHPLSQLENSYSHGKRLCLLPHMPCCAGSTSGHLSAARAATASKARLSASVVEMSVSSKSAATISQQAVTPGVAVCQPALLLRMTPLPFLLCTLLHRSASAGCTGCETKNRERACRTVCSIVQARWGLTRLQ